ncbi:type II toxin-antitoxin system HicB family antitoxin [Methanoplanus endosymbiosus]|uniref:Type II toxin-antitoxin system HicB family antitoxin n=1 Tax=Methanoplanus endosymbiosus TaxID=33865 RepID=A0A9E7PKG3_9EURY|nr:type II toxin-antitoxin system HicB family antitoxin [Methanoplanus endosymbiosus]UUX91495.1 type II toxin-antitoxin system HicB family antitoxin [Methanoplanus endosymbiosus]
MKFQVIIREDPEDGGYNVSCPAIQGCHSQGETVDEALENIKDAINGCIEVLNEDTLQNGNSGSRVMEVSL